MLSNGVVRIGQVREELRMPGVREQAVGKCETIPSRGSNRCKGPEAGALLYCSDTG